MPSYPSKALEDKNLFPVIEAASMELRSALASVLATKKSCSIDAKETGVAALTHELQLMGGNTLANMMRRSGVTYREIVTNAVEMLYDGRAKPSLLGECELAVAQEVVDVIVEELDRDALAQMESQLAAIPGATVSLDSLRHLSLIPKVARGPVLRVVMLPHIGKVEGVFSGDADLEDYAAHYLVSWMVGLFFGVLGAFEAIFGEACSVTIPSIAIVHLMRLEAQGAKAV